MHFATELLAIKKRLLIAVFCSIISHSQNSAPIVKPAPNLKNPVTENSI